MKEIKKNKFLLVLLVILIGVSVYLLYFYNKEDTEKYYIKDADISLKHYEENEYIPVNITYDQIARIYLQDYVFKLLYNREDAYNTLDENYRKAKFSSFDDFNEYVDSFLVGLKLQEMIVKKYSITEQSDYRYYDVYDSGDNLFVFKESGVMQYTVFFDRSTVIV